MQSRPLFLALLVSVTGCSNASDIVSCGQTYTAHALSPGLRDGGWYQCVDYAHPTPSFLDPVQANCLSGTTSEGPNYTLTVVSIFAGAGCTHVNAIGGWRWDNGDITVTEWHYAPTDGRPGTETAATLPQSCADSHLTYVAP